MVNNMHSIQFHYIYAIFHSTEFITARSLTAQLLISMIQIPALPTIDISKKIVTVLITYLEISI